MAKSARPPIGKRVDLRDFKWMPLDVIKLHASETWARAGKIPFAAYALINLWTKSWHQVPPGSLPDDDELLKGWADVPNWGEVKAIAMRGWEEFNDGRLYHLVIVEAAQNAWKKKTAVSESKRRDRLRKQHARSAKAAKKATETTLASDGHPTGHPTEIRSIKGHGEREGLAEDSATPATQNHNENLPLAVESKKIVDNGYSGDWSDPERRDSFAISKLVPYISARTDEERWAIAQAAEDPEHKHHRAAVTKCLAASKRAKVGWVSPSRRSKPAKKRATP